MFQNYFILGLRTLLKRKVYSFINIAGLALALGCSLVCFAFISFFYRADQFHENVERLYTIQQVSLQEGREEFNGKTPMPLAGLVSKLSGVDGVSRVNRKSGLITVDDETFEENFTFADSNFLGFFTFPLKTGNKESWGDASHLILSEEAAIKYFGDNDPVGQSVDIRVMNSMGNEVKGSFVVAGVAARFPENASFRFRILLPFDFQITSGLAHERWTESCDGTFILLDDAQQLSAIDAQTQQFAATYNSFNPELPIQKFHLEPLTTASLNSYRVSGDVFSGAPKFVFIVLVVISSLLIVMACFNYMNLAIASSAYRLKEIGVRKVMGSSRSQLILQFVAENGLLCLMALTLGLIAAETLLLPGLNSAFGLAFTIDYSNPALWVVFVALVIVSALGGAGYPALYVSSFQPGQVLKDKVHLGGKNKFRRFLLSFQFFLSYVSITTAFAFIMNSNFQRNKSWGYNEENKVVVKLTAPDQFLKIRNELSANPAVTSVTGSVESLGQETSRQILNKNSETTTIDVLHVGDGYLQAMEINIVEGRQFESFSESDFRESVIVNETFQKRHGVRVGDQVTLDSARVVVIGIARDFHFQPFIQLIEPLVIRYAREGHYRYAIASTIKDQSAKVRDAIRGVWKQISPERPLIVFDQRSVFDNSFREMDTATNVMRATAVITLFIALIGLFGLTSLTLARKLKELSVRKVMGANVRSLSWVLGSEIVWLMVFAFACGIPLSYFFLKNFLRSVSEYAQPQSPLLFIGTASALIFLSLLTISLHLYGIVKLSPLKHLRDE